MHTQEFGMPAEKQRWILQTKSCNIRSRGDNKTKYKNLQELDQKEDTELSKYIWKLKENNTKFELKLKILKKVKSIRNGGKFCRLCTTEAKMIINNKKGPLNARKEIMKKCRHRAKLLLKNWKPERQTKTNLLKTPNLRKSSRKPCTKPQLKN